MENETSLEIHFTIKKRGQGKVKGNNDLPDFDKDLNIITGNPEQTFNILHARREDILVIKSILGEKPVVVNGNGSELIIRVSQLGSGELKTMIQVMEVFANTLKN